MLLRRLALELARALEYSSRQPPHVKHGSWRQNMGQPGFLEVCQITAIVQRDSREPHSSKHGPGADEHQESLPMHGCLQEQPRCLKPARPHAAESWPFFRAKHKGISSIPDKDCTTQFQAGSQKKSITGKHPSLYVERSRQQGLSAAAQWRSQAHRNYTTEAQVETEDDPGPEPKRSLYVQTLRQQEGSMRVQRRASWLANVVKRLPVDADLQVELAKLGRLRQEFWSPEVRFALRLLSKNELGKKTAPDWERGLLLAEWWLETQWDGAQEFPHAVLNVLWKMLGQAGRTDQIWRLYEKFKERRGVYFGGQVAGNVMRALFKAGDYSGVLDVLGEAQENGWAIFQYDEAIQSQLKLGKLDEALLTFDQAKAEAKDTPVSVETYKALLVAGLPLLKLRSGKNDVDLAVALGQLGDTEEAVSLLKDIVFVIRKGFFFPMFVWIDAIVAAVEMGRLEEARLFREKGEAADFDLAAGMSYYARKRHVLYSQKALLALLKLDPRLNVKGIGPAVISMLCTSQRADEAVEVRLGISLPLF
jgi:tetratricopeptide (TPR) repeat protein